LFIFHLQPIYVEGAKINYIVGHCHITKWSNYFRIKSHIWEIISQFIDTEGRIILLNINIKDTIFTLVCLYAPNCKTTKNNFFKKVNTFLKDHGIGIPVIVWDLKETLKEIDRRSNSSKTKYQTVNSLKTLLKTNDLIDIWRELNNNKRQFTWRRKDKSQASRMDYIVVLMSFLKFSLAPLFLSLLFYQTS
jgi:exonuclease III